VNNLLHFTKNRFVRRLLVNFYKKEAFSPIFLVRYLDSSSCLWYIDKNGWNMPACFPKQKIVKEKPI